MFMERKRLNQIKKLELEMLAAIRKMAIESPGAAKAAFNLTDDQIKMFQKIKESNLILLFTEANNVSLVKQFDDTLLNQLSDESLDVSEFEMLADISRS